MTPCSHVLQGEGGDPSCHLQSPGVENVQRNRTQQEDSPASLAMRAAEAEDGKIHWLIGQTTEQGGRPSGGVHLGQHGGNNRTAAPAHTEPGPRPHDMEVVLLGP